MQTLENAVLKVEIADLGAELSSVMDKENGRERLHNADPAVWDRHAPILFPFVGKVTGGVYRIGDKEYPMKFQHGFARDMDFEVVEKGEDFITHRLRSTEATKEIYPFEFELLVTHELDQVNPRLLHVKCEVKNCGDDTMYYFIGGHPGFATAEKDPAAKEEYYLKFEGCDSIEYFGTNLQSTFATPQDTMMLKLDQGYLKFHQDIYMTLIFDHQKFDKVSICRPDKTPYVTMECGQFTSFGIWAREDGNFICLEPWEGRTDDHGFTGTIDQKIGVNILKPSESRVICHSIEFHK